jgi:5,10-methenyltetrahydromethanopterin hydrogenase
MVATWRVRAVSPEGLVTFWDSCTGVLQAPANRLAGMVRHQRDQLGRTLRIEA